jgi:hypothetical protein
MTKSNTKKFLALYLTPASVIAEWSKTDPSTKKAAEEKMRNDWNNWMSAHRKMIADTESGGKTKRVTSNGISDTKNDIMLYSIVEAETHDVAAKAFANHPHLHIPQSSIEVMEIKPMSGA